MCYCHVKSQFSVEPLPSLVSCIWMRCAEVCDNVRAGLVKLWPPCAHWINHVSIFASVPHERQCQHPCVAKAVPVGNINVFHSCLKQKNIFVMLMLCYFCSLAMWFSGDFCSSNIPVHQWNGWAAAVPCMLAISCDLAGLHVAWDLGIHAAK